MGISSSFDTSELPSRKRRLMRSSPGSINMEGGTFSQARRNTAGVVFIDETRNWSAVKKTTSLPHGKKRIHRGKGGPGVRERVEPRLDNALSANVKETYRKKGKLSNRPHIRAHLPRPAAIVPKRGKSRLTELLPSD